MSVSAAEIDNPAMGARIRFTTVAQDSGGRLLEMDFLLRPGGVIAVDHVHPRQEERFEVVSGSVVGHVGGSARQVGRGGTSVVPPGVAHAWRNASSEEEAHLRVQFRPALRTEEFFRTVFALGRAGRAGANGVPRFPERLALLAAFPDEFRPAALPRTAHKVLVRVLAPSGWWLLRRAQTRDRRQARQAASRDSSVDGSRRHG